MSDIDIALRPAEEQFIHLQTQNSNLLFVLSSISITYTHTQ